jgi:hypothetical protein
LRYEKELMLGQFSHDFSALFGSFGQSWTGETKKGRKNREK